MIIKENGEIDKTIFAFNNDLISEIDLSVTFFNSKISSPEREPDSVNIIAIPAIFTRIKIVLKF